MVPKLVGEGRHVRTQLGAKSYLAITHHLYTYENTESQRVNWIIHKMMINNLIGYRLGKAQYGITRLRYRGTKEVQLLDWF